MLRIACNPSLKGLSVFCPGIVYSTQTGKDITLDLLMPQIPEEGPARTQNTAIISFSCSPGKIPFPAEIMNGLWNSFSSFFFPNCRKLPKAAPTPFPNHRIIMI